jgi:hypothetical protein
MANVSSRLCNPTPFDVDWCWHAGIVITIPKDGHTDLDYRYVHDFREGNPGSEAVLDMMDHLGIFLRDYDFSYETQALKSINASLKSKKGQYNQAIENFKTKRASLGIKDEPEAFEATLRAAGYAGVREDGSLGLREQIEKLEHRKAIYTEAVSAQKVEAKTKDLDPEVTLIFVNPPKVFDSPVALRVFLSEPGNESIKAQYEAWYDQVTSKVEPDVEESTEAVFAGQ